jgi:hypothetical protein
VAEPVPPPISVVIPLASAKYANREGAVQAAVSVFSTDERVMVDREVALSFKDILSFGTGLELDTSARETVVSRTRLMARYKIGENVTGWSIGLAVTF